MKLLKLFVIASCLFLSLNAQSAEKIYFVQSDHLGTPVVLTDESQTIVWRAGDDPFGGAAPLVEQITFNIRFPGQYFDAESGLHYNWNRYYDPSTGRYVTSDPTGLDGGLNTFGYVGGNPLIHIDPNGLNKIAKWCICIALELFGGSIDQGAGDGGSSGPDTGKPRTTKPLPSSPLSCGPNSPPDGGNCPDEPKGKKKPPPEQKGPKPRKKFSFIKKLCK